MNTYAIVVLVFAAVALPVLVYGLVQIRKAEKRVNQAMKDLRR